MPRSSCSAIQDVAADVLELEEDRERQNAPQDPFRPEAGSLDRAHRYLGALGRLVRRAGAFGVDVLEDPVVPHERHGRRGHAAARGRAVAVFDHPPRQGSEQQVEQVVPVAAHQRACQQQGLASLRRQHAHGLALSTATVLVLVCLVGNAQVERALRQVALDELGRLVAALAKAELHVGHRTLHARGDHVNNTPRQINILQALGAPVPTYAHVSMILGDDGQKLSKRHGAVNVMEYEANGYLPEAIVNYLARLGWSHGDDEVFSRTQLVEWFDLDHITPSAAQFNTEKLNWLNAHYIKAADNARLAALVQKRFDERGVKVTPSPSLEAIIGLYKERVGNINELADAAEVFYIDLHPKAEILAQHLTDDVKPALADFAEALQNVAWEAPAIGALIKETVGKHGLKMPKLAMPLRVLLTGQAQTPSVDAVVALFPRETAIARLQRGL